jgi:hypothetical protein
LLSQSQLNRRIRALEPELRALQRVLPRRSPTPRTSTESWTPR